MNAKGAYVSAIPTAYARVKPRPYSWFEAKNPVKSAGEAFADARKKLEGALPFAISKALSRAGASAQDLSISANWKGTTLSVIILTRGDQVLMSEHRVLIADTVREQRDCFLQSRKHEIRYEIYVDGKLAGYCH